MSRVAELMRIWARERGEEGGEEARWVAAGQLHDALRDADGNELSRGLGPLADELPLKTLHGPAVALRLREEGVKDEDFLHALAYHTLGSPDFSTLGLALYAADFLEPGRDMRNEWREALRGRAARELEKVAREILRARMEHLLRKGRPLRPETVAFWNRMAEGQAWVSASEL
jgi:2-amino-4-hydroxy-6-hydroxymethyldihydropteridine diphosphokinase